MDGFTSYTIERKLQAPVERVWRAFVEPEEFARWVWGADAKNVRAEMDLRPGGMLRVSMDAGGETWQFRGIYAAIDAPRRLAHSVHWDASVGYNEDGANPVDEMIVVELEPDGDGTALRYSHYGIPDDGRSAPEHERSVAMTLDVMKKIVES